METLATGLFLAAVNTALINYLAEPIRQKYPNLDLWWLLYVALGTGFAVAWFAGVNLFGAYIENELLGRVLSGFLVGGGSKLIYDIFDKPADAILLEAEFPDIELTDVSSRID
jgi:hypothetical protein